MSLLIEKYMVYDCDNHRDMITVDCQDLYEYLSANENKHDMIRHNLLNATLNFHHRLKMFVKNIIMNSACPLKSNITSTKLILP